MSYVRNFSQATQAFTNQAGLGFSYVAKGLSTPFFKLQNRIANKGDDAVNGLFPDLSEFYDLRVINSVGTHAIKNEKLLYPVVYKTLKVDQSYHERCVMTNGLFPKFQDVVIGLTVNQAYGSIVLISIKKLERRAQMFVEFSGVRIYSSNNQRINFIVRTVDAHAIRIKTNYPVFGVQLVYFDKLPLTLEMDYCVNQRNKDDSLFVSTVLQSPYQLSVLPMYDSNIVSELYYHCNVPVIAGSSFTFVKVVGQITVLFGGIVYNNVTDTVLIVPNPVERWVTSFVISFSVTSTARVVAYVRDSDEGEYGDLRVIFEQTVGGGLSKL